MLIRNLVVFLVTLLTYTLSFSHANRLQKCHFNSLASLESCRSSLWSDTQDSCPNNLPIAGSVTLGELFDSGNGFIRQRNWEYWDESRDETLDYHFEQAVRGHDTWARFLRHIPGWNLETFAAALVCLWIILIPFLILPFCCVACCGKRKLRKPLPLVFICFLALATCLAGIFLLYRATKETAYLHESLADIGCIVPRTTYAALYLNLEGSAGKHAGLSDFNRQLDIFELELKDSSDYLAALKAKSLLKFAVHGLYGPYIWTHNLLSQSKYNAWPSADATKHDPITLNHTILGYKALELAGVISSDETKTPYAPVFAAIDAIQEPTWNQAEVSDTLKTLQGYLTDSKSFINTLLQRISDVINDDAFIDSSIIDDAPILAPLYMMTYLPIIGLVGGFGLFVLYMLRHDNEHSTRHVGRGRLALTAFFCCSYAAFGIFLMLLSALILAAIRAGHAGCDFVDKGILTEGKLDGIMTLTPSEQNVVDKCIKRGGDGDLISAFFDLSSTNILDSFIGDSWDFNLTQSIVFTKEQLELQNSDYLGFVIPLFNPAQPILAQTSTELFWASTELETHTVDCNGAGNHYICEALKDLHSAGSSLNTSDYPWAGADPLTIHGTQDGSMALSRLVSTTRCHDMIVCIDHDFRCASNIRIGASTIGYIDEALITNDVSDNWAKITHQAARNDQVRELFECFITAPEKTKLAWVNGVRWVVLRDLLNGKLIRPDTSIHNDQTASVDGYPGYFDVCPRTEACHVMSTFVENSNHTRLTETGLISPLEARERSKASLKMAFAHTDGNAVVDMVQQVALVATPMAKLRKSLNDVATNFNCALVGDAVQVLHNRICPGLMGSGAYLATVWFAISVVHAVAFFMTFIYWFRRKRATDEISTTEPHHADDDDAELRSADSLIMAA